jgi:hypothetical protein
MLDLDESLRELRRELELVKRAIQAMESVPSPPVKSRRGRKSMGHEERAVVSERMKRYWASRRKTS